MLLLFPFLEQLQCFFVLPNTILSKAAPECFSKCPSSVFTYIRVAALLLQENKNTHVIIANTRVQGFRIIGID